MISSKAMIDGVMYLANTYCGGSAWGEVAISRSDDAGSLRIYLAGDEKKVFSEADINTMEAFGFHYSPLKDDGISCFEWRKS